MWNFLYILLSAFLFLTDQGFKRDVKQKYQVGERSRKAHCGGLVTILHSRNDGAAFNLMAKYPALIRLISVVLTLLCALIFLVTLTRGGSGLLKTGMALLTGGAFSNTLDRVREQHVTDYISFRFGPPAFRKIAFNIADFAIAVGAVLAVISSGAE